MDVRAPNKIDKEVYDTFIKERQLNKEEDVIYAVHKSYEDDFETTQYLKVITINNQGDIKVYLKDVGDKEWFSRYLHLI